MSSNKFLLIHTSLDRAFAAIVEEQKVLSVRYSKSPKEHSSFLHVALSNLMKENQLDSSGISGIGVTGGPGSYTGIRVGLSAAKGLAYAWNKPLMVCSNLMALAATAADHFKHAEAVYIPVIHARQNEYYIGYYNEKSTSLRPDSLRVLDQTSFSDLKDARKIIFGVGLDGVQEATGMIPLGGMDEVNAESMAAIISKMFYDKKMTDAENAVPIYLKDVFIGKH